MAKLIWQTDKLGSLGWQSAENHIKTKSQRRFLTVLINLDHPEFNFLEILDR
jgi:hypothetical protein